MQVYREGEKSSQKTLVIVAQSFENVLLPLALVQLFF